MYFSIPLGPAEGKRANSQLLAQNMNINFKISLQKFCEATSNCCGQPYSTTDDALEPW